MTVLASYSDLLSEMDDWLNRSDLTAKIPTFIRLFESEMNRRLRSPDMEQSFSFEATEGTDTYDISSRVRALRSAYVETDPITNLVAMTPAVLRSSYPFGGEHGQPVAYTVTGENLVLAPTPDASYTVVYTGYAKLTGLDANNATNWLLDDHPDVYLAGSLFFAYAYLKDDDHAMMYRSAWDGAVASIVREANEKRLPAGPLQVQPTVYE